MVYNYLHNEAGSLKPEAYACSALFSPGYWRKPNGGKGAQKLFDEIKIDHKAVESTQLPAPDHRRQLSRQPSPSWNNV